MKESELQYLTHQSEDGDGILPSDALGTSEQKVYGWTDTMSQIRIRAFTF